MGLQHLKNRLGKLTIKQPERLVIQSMGFVPNRLKPFLNRNNEPFYLELVPEIPERWGVSDVHETWDQLLLESEEETDVTETDKLRLPQMG